jgi:hypothetical protein
MFEITTKGRTAKICGLPIFRVPKGKVALIRNFHFMGHSDSGVVEVIKHGEISFISTEQYDYNGSNYPIIDIRYCKFEGK